MRYKELLKRINDYELILPKTARKEMRVVGKVIASNLLVNAMEDEAIKQLSNVCCLPGVIEPVIALPDAHVGYGLPMGAVAAFDSESGIISSGLCGFDINCGINSIRTNLSYEEVKDKLNTLINELFNAIPCGVGSKGKLKLTPQELDSVLVNGAKWAVEHGYAIEEDLLQLEERGCMEGADPSLVSDTAKRRGLQQLGTLGAGNHFLELQKVTHIFDEIKAKEIGITEKNQVLIMLHSGSRGFGHQVASDYLRIQEQAVKRYNIWLPDRQLACAPVHSKEAQDYFKAMKCAVNYSFTNRLIMTHWIRKTFEKVFKKSWEELEIYTVYGLCHNVVKFEEHIINGLKKKVFVHRKGATRSFPEQTVLLAGSMGTASYILKGTEIAMKKTFGSSAHGAGRVMSRHAAIRRFFGQQIQKELANRNIVTKSPHPKSLAEEAPKAYKDIESVVETIHNLGISLKVVRMEPIGVLKG